ncbi:MAG: hydantoinase B/oxoprolinase family protein [Thermodesulfobacteriota bacterium]|nr:hydantoinase B/oxoprolinase family protein [Thermodesulfobacteriota bacterium]
MKHAIDIEVFNKIFSSIADEMGIILRRSSFSPNIKERRDFSCALFDHSGELIAQAAHIPVHLGAMPLTMIHILNCTKFDPNDVVILNDPYHGGTHLPDITLMAPVFCGTSQPIFFVANRAHHTDIGGKAPGSMSPAQDIREEGYLIKPTKLSIQGILNEDLLNDFLPHVRNSNERMGDLQAQLASLNRGIQRLEEIVRKYGKERIVEMGHLLKEYSEKAMRSAIREIQDGTYSFRDYLDDDGVSHDHIQIIVSVTIECDEVLADFTKTVDQVAGNVNTVSAVTHAAVYYVFLSLLNGNYPINHGCFKPIKIITREGSLLNANYPAAVAAGNVETSQRIVDTLLGALSQAIPHRIPAASSGSMNNIAVGGIDPSNDRTFTYYETIAGGMGARPYAPGLDAVHTHMTNTLNTPIEALEHSYPLCIESYKIIRGSGGTGRYRGGNGIQRELRFLTDAQISVLSDRRKIPPYGLFNGNPGHTGKNILIRGGKKEYIPSKVFASVKKGDILCIQTPGGGGFGKTQKRSR